MRRLGFNSIKLQFGQIFSNPVGLRKSIIFTTEMTSNRFDFSCDYNDFAFQMT